MDFTMLRPKAVYAALAEHPDRPSARTVDRWCAGAVVPAWAQHAVAEALGMPQTQQSAPPDESDGAVLEQVQALRADVGQIITRPEVLELVAAAQDSITTEVQLNREVLVAALGREVGRLMGEALRDNLQPLLDELTHANGHQEE